MPSGLVRLQQTGHSHFVTFTCYRRSKNMCEAAVCAVVLQCLENARLRYQMRIYGYVLMPEHVHLLVSEPERGTLAQALQSLKSASARVARRVNPASAPRFWPVEIESEWTAMRRAGKDPQLPDPYLPDPYLSTAGGSGAGILLDWPGAA